MLLLSRPRLRSLVSSAAIAATLLLSACGGGGGGSPAPLYSPGAFPPSSSVAGICTPEGEKQFVRSYLDEIYLWYNEIRDVDPAAYASVTDYFYALLVRTPDITGQPKDRFSTVMTKANADALQASALPMAQHTEPSVPLTKVVTSSTGRQVGYVLFNDHSEGAQDELIAAFQSLKQSGVNELVLDLRNNGGGFLYVAQTAASMVTGPQSEGMVFERLAYNAKRAAESAANTFYFSSRVQTAETTYPAGTPLPQLNLPRVYVLTSDVTCSASESIINSLRGIDVQVVLVGDTTCGKPYGFHRQDNCGLAFFPIEFQGYNAKGFGDYMAGFAPTCAVADDYTTPLGSTNEPLFSAALRHIDTGSCPASTATAMNTQGAMAQSRLLSRRANAPASTRHGWDGRLLRR